MKCAVTMQNETIPIKSLAVWRFISGTLNSNLEETTKNSSHPALRHYIYMKAYLLLLFLLHRAWSPEPPPPHYS